MTKQRCCWEICLWDFPFTYYLWLTVCTFRLQWKIPNPPVLALMRRKHVAMFLTHFCGWRQTFSESQPSFMGCVWVDFSRIEAHQCRGSKRGLCLFTGKPHQQLVGQNSSGQWLTKLAQPYPLGLCDSLAKCFLWFWGSNDCIPILQGTFRQFCPVTPAGLQFWAMSSSGVGTCVNFQYGSKHGPLHLCSFSHRMLADPTALHRSLSQYLATITRSSMVEMKMMMSRALLLMRISCEEITKRSWELWWRPREDLLDFLIPKYL